MVKIPNFFQLGANLFDTIAILGGLAGLMILWGVFSSVADGSNPTGQPTSIIFAVSLAVVPYCIGGAFSRLAKD